MAHLQSVLQKTNLRRHDIVVMTVRPVSAGAGEYELSDQQLFSDYEKELLSSVVSPMASGVVAVGLFGATWVAGVVGGVGEVLGNEGVARVGTVSRVLLPTDGLWRGAMHAFQDPSALTSFGFESAGFPFLSEAPLTAAVRVLRVHRPTPVGMRPC